MINKLCSLFSVMATVIKRQYFGYFFKQITLKLDFAYKLY